MMVSTGLERLDNATRSKLRSTQILTSLPQIISELIQNSLDAGAKTVEIGAHCGDWSCWVRDDGFGLNKDGLALIAKGIEGGRYTSSKSYSPASLDELSTFGFRGEALASAADLSCMEISSRTSKSKESWSVILKGGEKLYYGPSLRWRREGAGTTVSIQDAFFNLPIRRLSHPNPARTIDLVRREIETIALAFPCVMFTLKDLSKEDCDFYVDRSRILTIPKTSSSLLTFRHIYGRALVEHVDTIDVQSGSLKLEGFVSLIGSHSKAHQFLYLNRHILDTCELHRLIDKCFASSTFSKHAFDESSEQTSQRPGTRRSPRKGESRPIYVLNLTVPSRDIDNCLEPAKASVHLQNQELVASFLVHAIQSFLVRHGFKSAETSNTYVDHATPSKKRRRLDDSDFSRVNDSNEPEPPLRASNHSLDGRGSTESLYIQGPSPNNDAEIKWVDPVTGRTYLIDPRTGNSYLQDLCREGLDDSDTRRSAHRRSIVDTRWLHTCSGASSHPHDEGEMPDWIRQALESNDAFASTERAVPCLPSSKNKADGLDTARRLPWTKQCYETFSTPTQLISSLGGIPNCSFSKEGLAGVQILGQVDRKFIACLINSSHEDEDLPEDSKQNTSSWILVLVDQHAADERVRVERFLKLLCLGYLDRDGVGVERRYLDPPAPVLLTKFERDRLMGSARIKKAFRNWGFDLVEAQTKETSLGTSESDEGYGTVYYSSVPEVVADKLLAGSGNDLREVVKGYLARFEAENVDDFSKDTQTSPSVEDADEFAWLRALRHCPRELIELVNSRACRGAIMFNDQLSVMQCKRLLRQLSMTAFPFQCAHGRPSIVPLTVDPRGGAGKPDLRAIEWDKLA